MITRKHKHDCLEDLFLAYYTVRKFNDIWPENRKPDTIEDFAHYRRREKINEREKELKAQGKGKEEIEAALIEYEEQLKFQDQNDTLDRSPNISGFGSSNFGDGNISSNE